MRRKSNSVSNLAGYLFLPILKLVMFPPRKKQMDQFDQFDANQDETWRWIFGIYDILENITQRKIDLISSKFIDNSIKESVLSNIINIY